MRTIFVTAVVALLLIGSAVWAQTPTYEDASFDVLTLNDNFGTPFEHVIEMEFYSPDKAVLLATGSAYISERTSTTAFPDFTELDADAKELFVISSVTHADGVFYIIKFLHGPPNHHQLFTATLDEELNRFTNQTVVTGALTPYINGYAHTDIGGTCLFSINYTGLDRWLFDTEWSERTNAPIYNTTTEEYVTSNNGATGVDEDFLLFSMPKDEETNIHPAVWDAEESHYILDEATHWTALNQYDQNIYPSINRWTGEVVYIGIDESDDNTYYTVLVQPVGDDGTCTGSHDSHEDCCPVESCVGFGCEAYESLVGCSVDDDTTDDDTTDDDTTDDDTTDDDTTDDDTTDDDIVDDDVTDDDIADDDDDDDDDGCGS